MKAYEIEKHIREDGIRIMILDNPEEQIPEERILAKFESHYHLTREMAKKDYDRFAREV